MNYAQIAFHTRYFAGTTTSLNESDVEGRYALSIYPEHERVLAGVDYEDWASEIQDYVENLPEDLKQTPGNCLGTWYDTKNDKVYLDVSVVVDSAETAEMLCKKFNQLAYYDLLISEEVRVEPEYV